MSPVSPRPHAMVTVTMYSPGVGWGWPVMGTVNNIIKAGHSPRQMNINAEL